MVTKDSSIIRATKKVIETTKLLNHGKRFLLVRLPVLLCATEWAAQKRKRLVLLFVSGLVKLLCVAFCNRCSQERVARITLGAYVHIRIVTGGLL